MLSAVRFCLALLLLCNVALFPLSVQAAPEVLRIGVYENPPKVTIDENGDVSGIFGEIIMEIAEQENWKIETVPCSSCRSRRLISPGDMNCGLITPASVTQITSAIGDRTLYNVTACGGG